MNRFSEEDFSSCILHDFLKSTEDHHDKKLVNYFPMLLSETYDHSNPKNIGCLVLADRIELRRYDDYKSWVDDRYNSIYDEFDDSTKILLKIFYEKIRPALSDLYESSFGFRYFLFSSSYLQYLF